MPPATAAAVGVIGYQEDETLAKLYYIDCKGLGIDCVFETHASTIEEVIELCAEHGRSEHDMRSFSPDLYAKMRACVNVVEDDSVNQQSTGAR